MLQPAVLLHQLVQLGLLGGVAELLFDMRHAATDAGQLARAGEHLGQDGAAA